MKKQRPPKASPKRANKAARRARKAAKSRVLQASASNPIIVDTWSWHQAATAQHGPKPKRPKGAPPRAANSKSKALPAAQAPRPASKLAPVLIARLATPLPAPALPIDLRAWAQQRLAAEWRSGRAAAVLLLMPALLATVLLTRARHVKSPPPHTLIVAAVPAPAAIARPAVIAAPEPPVVLAGPPFVRPPESLTVTVPVALHDLAAVMAALAEDAARRPSPARQAPDIPATEESEVAVVIPPLPFDPPALPAELLPPVIIVEHHLPPEPPPALEATALATAVAPPAEAICRAPPALLETRAASRSQPAPAAAAQPADDPLSFGMALATAAKAQTHELVVYNARYMSISYPRGDVPSQFGVCTDVVIRAYRALDIDLQELVHLSRTGASDPSIDHRRTELLRHFFATHGEQLQLSPYSEAYLPGDIVTYYRPQNRSSTAHIAIVTDAIAPSGRPMVAHNRGWGVQLEDALFVDQMTGHYRFRGLSNTATAALPRSIQMAALPKRPLQRTGVAAVTPGGAPQSLAAATSAATAPAAVRQSAAEKSLRPPMGLGLPPQ